MINIDLIGSIIKMRAQNQSNDSISSTLTASGYSTVELSAAMDAIEKDELFVVRTIVLLALLNPTYYTIGIHKIGVEKRIMWGVLRDENEIGIRTIDNIRVEQSIIGASIVIVHADKSEVRMDKISKADAEMIEKLFGYVIEAQRTSVVNIATD